MDTLRPNEKRAKTALALIWIILILEFISIASGYLQLELLQAAIDGAEVSMEDADANDTREQVVSVLYLLAYITSIVTFILWFRRAYFNLHLRVPGLAHEEGAAASSWFIPFVNLYRPFQIMNELYVETKGFLIKRGVDVGSNLSTSWVVGWWAFWILNNIIGQISLRVTLRAETIDELINATKINIANNLVGIPLALLTVKVISEYSKAETLLAAIKGEDLPTAPS